MLILLGRSYQHDSTTNSNNTGTIVIDRNLGYGDTVFNNNTPGTGS